MHARLQLKRSVSRTPGQMARMSKPDVTHELRRLAGALAAAHGTTQEHQAIRSFLLGALYSLDTAVQLGFLTRAQPGRSPTYEAQVTRLTRQLERGSGISRGTWLAGLYFNSSLQHLAGAYHRLLKLVTGSDHSVVPCLVDIGIAQGRFTSGDVDALNEVHKDVNDLKHSPVGLLRRRRVADIKKALRAAQQALELFERST
jgi:hypothetical protein